jgi:hypothetical protein
MQNPPKKPMGHIWENEMPKSMGIPFFKIPCIIFSCILLNKRPPNITGKSRKIKAAIDFYTHSVLPLEQEDS